MNAIEAWLEELEEFAELGALEETFVDEEDDESELLEEDSELELRVIVELEFFEGFLVLPPLPPQACRISVAKRNGMYNLFIV